MYTSYLPARQELKPPPAEDVHETGCFNLQTEWNGSAQWHFKNGKQKLAR
jgi:hypothetical protein